ncbi:MAG TPA: hypothetical protein VG371_16250 [Solirubrobacteraceae bacterium]|jgi:hypothetical protein|nr:hypothetical protein [Solirubrobacteraceae bacterium]
MFAEFADVFHRRSDGSAFQVWELTPASATTNSTAFSSGASFTMADP